MTEFEILLYSQNSFSKMRPIVVTILVCLNFYLIRNREVNMPVYGKGLTTLFGLMTVYFGWTVGTFLISTQVNMAYSLTELKNSGTSISATSEAFITYMGNPTSPYMANVPDTPTMVFWGVIALMFYWVCGHLHLKELMTNNKMEVHPPLSI